MPPSSLDDERESDHVVATVSVAGRISRAAAGRDRGKVVILIESRPLLQLCLSRWLEEDVEMSRLMTFASPADIGPGLTEDQPVDLVIWSSGGLILSQPDALRGLERLKAGFPGVPLVLLADREDVADVAEAIRAGASGYIPTSLDRSEISGILRFVRSGGTFVPASIVLDRSAHAPRGERSSPEPASPFRVLTAREREVVNLLRQAKSNKVIAYELDLSESTVKVIVHRILGKLNAANRTEVACLAQKCLEGQMPGTA